MNIVVEDEIEGRFIRKVANTKGFRRRNISPLYTIISLVMAIRKSNMTEMEKEICQQ